MQINYNVHHLFAPVSQKFLLGPSNTEHNKYGRCLDLESDVNYLMSCFGSAYFYQFKEISDNILQNFDELCKLPLPKRNAGKTSTRQPTWNIDQYNQFRNVQKEGDCEEILIPDDRITACYKPAHTNNSNQYGIHIYNQGIAKLVQQLEAKISKQTAQSREVLILVAMQYLFAHECCHAWIEDLNCLIDFVNGEKADTKKRRYAEVQERYNWYIFMEEAICETAAYSWSRHFLYYLSSPEKTIPQFSSDVIHNALYEIMKLGPIGYRNFHPIFEKPIASNVFYGNLIRLLAQVYDVDHEINEKYQIIESDQIFRSMQFFFDSRVFDIAYYNAKREDRIHPYCTYNRLWKGYPPVFIYTWK